MKKGLVFGGLGLLFALSMWFIFAPSGKDKTAAEQGLNDSIPQATTEKLTENKLKAYELRQFGIRKCPKKLVISLLFCNFIVVNQ